MNSDADIGTHVSIYRWRDPGEEICRSAATPRYVLFAVDEDRRLEARPPTSVSLCPNPEILGGTPLSLIVDFTPLKSHIFFGALRPKLRFSHIGG
jgi:hypothetical protein